MSTRVEIRVHGAREAAQDLAAVPQKVRQPIRDALMALALLGQNAARRLVLRGPKTGRIYRRGKKVVHQASAPGEAPASDTGSLVARILGEAGTDDLSSRIAGRAAYAIHLEYGTKKMAARPFLRPAGESVREHGQRLLAAAVSEVLRTSVRRGKRS